jgi:hypothetical protein
MSSGPAVAVCPASFCSSGGLSIASVRVAGGPPSLGGWLSSVVVGSVPSGSGAVGELAGRMSGLVGLSVGAANGGSGPGFVIPGEALSGFSLERSDAPVVVPGVIGAAS